MRTRTLSPLLSLLLLSLLLRAASAADAAAAALHPSFEPGQQQQEEQEPWLPTCVPDHRSRGDPDILCLAGLGEGRWLGFG